VYPLLPGIIWLLPPVIFPLNCCTVLVKWSGACKLLYITYMYMYNVRLHNIQWSHLNHSFKQIRLKSSSNVDEFQLGALARDSIMSYESSLLASISIRLDPYPFNTFPVLSCTALYTVVCITQYNSIHYEIHTIQLVNIPVTAQNITPDLYNLLSRSALVCYIIVTESSNIRFKGHGIIISIHTLLLTLHFERLVSHLHDCSSLSEVRYT
jgi:hypothetical protein